MGNEKIPEEIEDQLKGWKRQANTLTLIYVLWGLIVSVVSEIIVSKFANEQISWIIAIVAGALTFSNFETKYNNQRKAWRMLNTAFLVYQKDGNLENLIAGYKKTKKIICNVDLEKEPVLIEIETLLKSWERQTKVLRALHVLLGLIAIISSVTVASRLITPESTMMAGIAWLAAITSTILTYMGLEAKSNNMRTAWRILNTAVLRYREDKDMKKLIEAYERGEEIIGDVKVTLSKS
jgi:hypothetical protein